MRRIFLVNTLFLIIFSGLPGVSLGAGLDLSAHQGKVVIVDFWASWCVPCRRSFPWMNAMQAKYADQGLVIIAVNMDADGNEAADFLREYPADFEIVYDPDGELAREYDVIAMPSSYVFDRQGKQIARHLGFKVSKQDEYESTLAEALSQ
jgi:thiol-disulfide isomerase/thioredoxin